MIPVANIIRYIVDDWTLGQKLDAALRGQSTLAIRDKILNLPRPIVEIHTQVKANL
jgi:hypothetical protein